MVPLCSKCVYLHLQVYFQLNNVASTGTETALVHLLCEDIHCGDLKVLDEPNSGIRNVETELAIQELNGKKFNL